MLCPGPVPTEWAEIADAQRFSIGIAQVSPADVAEAAIEGMLDGKRSVVPGLVPKVVGIGGRFAPRSLLLPAIRLGSRFRGGPSRQLESPRPVTGVTSVLAPAGMRPDASRIGGCSGGRDEAPRGPLRGRR